MTAGGAAASGDRDREQAVIERTREEIKATIHNISAYSSGKGRIFMGKTMI